MRRPRVRVLDTNGGRTPQARRLVTCVHAEVDACTTNCSPIPRHGSLLQCRRQRYCWGACGAALRGEVCNARARVGAGGEAWCRGDVWAHRKSLRPASSRILSPGRLPNFHPPARGEGLVGCREALSHSTRRVHISVRDPYPPRPRTSSHDHSPPLMAAP